MATMAHIKPLVRRMYRMGINGMFRSPAGRGKTTTIDEAVNELKAEDPTMGDVTFDGGTLAPTDVIMSMPDMRDFTIRQLRDSRLPNWHVNPDGHGIIRIGEWMLMSLEVSRGFQKLINKEELGGFRIPPGYIFLSDGNRLQDRSGAQAQSRAIMSRWDVYDLEFDVDHALDVAKRYYHERVAAFLIRNTSYIDNYADVFENDKRSANDLTLQEGKDGAWANLRTWDKISRKLRDVDATGEALLPDEITASVGSGVAAVFQTWMSMLDKLASMEDIVAKPKDAPVPETMAERYALSTMIALTVNKETFKPISIYLNRYPTELQASFFRLMNDRLNRQKDGNSTAIRMTEEYKKWIVSPHISKLLLGASQA